MPRHVQMFKHLTGLTRILLVLPNGHIEVVPSNVEHVAGGKGSVFSKKCLSISVSLLFQFCKISECRSGLDKIMCSDPGLPMGS